MKSNIVSIEWAQAGNPQCPFPYALCAKLASAKSIKRDDVMEALSELRRIHTESVRLSNRVFELVGEVRRLKQENEFMLTQVNEREQEELYQEDTKGHFHVFSLKDDEKVSKCGITNPSGVFLLKLLCQAMSEGFDGMAVEQLAGPPKNNFKISRKSA